DRYAASSDGAPVTPPVAGSPFADGAPAAEEASSRQGLAAPAPVPAEQRTPWWMHLIYWLAIGGLAGWALYQQGRAPRRRDVEALDEGSAAANAAPARVAPAPALAARPEPAPEPAPLASAEAFWERQPVTEDELPTDLLDDLPPVAAPAPPAGT